MDPKFRCGGVIKHLMKSRSPDDESPNVIYHQFFDLLSTSLQFFTLVFQSHVCRSTSNAKPAGQRTFANRLIAFKFSPELSHLSFRSDFFLCILFVWKICTHEADEWKQSKGNLGWKKKEVVLENH